MTNGPTGLDAYSDFSRDLPKLPSVVRRFRAYDGGARFGDMPLAFRSGFFVTNKHVVTFGGHFVPRDILIRESQEWLDRYLGEPARG